jgi:BCD family chlorophyll transporter-like MFS transporter
MKLLGALSLPKSIPGADNARVLAFWSKMGTSLLPFADAASAELPLSRLLRLSLFQVAVGIAVTLLVGTLNRVMIVELGVPAWLVAVMVSLPLFAAPFRALVGFKSDMHKSVFGWRRIPYLWTGAMLLYGGLAIMPFALLILSGDTQGPHWVGDAGAALAFLLVGAGLHTVQTAGLALAADLATPKQLPRVVGLLGVMMLVGIVSSALVFGVLLRHFSEIRLIQVTQGAAMVTLGLNIVALWKQETRDRSRAPRESDPPDFATAWDRLLRGHLAVRRLVAIGLGTVAFSMQDILLEPYGGQVLGLPVASTTSLTAVLGGGGIAGFAIAARTLGRNGDPFRLAAFGVLTGVVAFACVIFAAPLHAIWLFGIGVALIGFGAGLFAAGTLTAVMSQAGGHHAGLALGAWGAVQATAAGAAVAAGGLMRDGFAAWAADGRFGDGFTGPEAAYGVVYHTEILLLFATLVALGPLVRRTSAPVQSTTGLGVAGTAS